MVSLVVTLVLRPLAWANSLVFALGRQVAWLALAVMVLVILAQVFFRYILNNALAWPDEAARFLMLWMTALMAPSAMRWGGFVSIDMLPSALGRVASRLLTLALLLMALAVLVIAVQHGYKHVFGFGGRFNSSSLRLPLDWFGMEVVRVKLRYMYASLFVCVVLLISVTVELLLRSFVLLLRPDAELPSTGAPAHQLETD